MGCCCCGGGDGDRDRGCRPLGFLLGLPFALVAVLVSIVGAIIWIIGYASPPLSLALCSSLTNLLVPTCWF
jgi:hypothetical protein